MENWTVEVLLDELREAGGKVEGIMPDPDFWRAVYAAEKQGLVEYGQAGGGWDAYEFVELTRQGRLVVGLPAIPVKPASSQFRLWTWLFGSLSASRR